MDMLRIQQKIKMDEYEDIEQMSADVDLMVANAKAFYKRASQEYKDAGDLWDLFIESKCRLFDRDSPTEDSERKGKIILKMGKLVNAKNSPGIISVMKISDFYAILFIFVGTPCSRRRVSKTNHRRRWGNIRIIINHN